METLISVFSVSSVDFVKGFIVGLFVSLFLCFAFCKWFVNAKENLYKEKEQVFNTLLKENSENNAKSMQILERNYITQIQELKDLLERQKSIYETQRHIQATNDAAASAGVLKL